MEEIKMTEAEEAEVRQNLEITDEMMAAWLDDCTAYAVKVLHSGPKRDFIPTLFLHGIEIDDATRSTKRSVEKRVLVDFDEDRRRTDMALMGYNLGQDMKVLTAVFFISEVWVSMQDPNLPRKYAMPSQDPERREEIMIAGCTLDGRAVANSIPIRRNPMDFMIAGVPKKTADLIQPHLLYAFLKSYRLGIQKTLREREANDE